MPARPRPVGPDVNGVVDLDARRAARLEAKGETKTVRFGGKEWAFKSELPLQVIENFSNGNVAGALSKMLADPDSAKDFLASADLTQDDFVALLEGTYGLSLPNS